MGILQSIDWTETTIDVLCIETDPAFRPAGHSEEISDFLWERGYRDAAGQQGRNRCSYHLLANDHTDLY